MEAGTMEVIELDEAMLDAPLVCTLTTAPCPNEATWSYVCVVCRGGRYFCCEPHHTQWYDWLVHMYEAHDGTVCSACNTHLTFDQCVESMTRL